MANDRALVFLLCMIFTVVCTTGQTNDYHHGYSSSNEPNSNPSSSSTSSYSSTHQGGGAILSFLALVIATCCCLGCFMRCVNVCFRSSARRRHRRRIRPIRGSNNPNMVQLPAVRDESVDKFEFEEHEEAELSKEDNKGILINLDEEMKLPPPQQPHERDVEAQIEEQDMTANVADTRLEIVEMIKREKTMCVICHDELSGNVRLLDCNHVFCDECIEQWEKEGKCLCPVCRQPTCSKKYVNKERPRRASSPVMFSQLQSGERVVIISQSNDNGIRSVRVLRANRSRGRSRGGVLSPSLPVRAFLL